MIAKYVEVGRITLRTQWAYLADRLLGTFFLAVILFVFVQLWQVTYAAQGGGLIDGYGMAEMIWYLVATEAIVLSLPPIHRTIEEEVKSGDLALRLNKPYEYLLFHYSTYVSDGLLRLLTCLSVGGATAYLLVGGFGFGWGAAPSLLVLYLTTQALHFLLTAAVGLTAFWTEDVTGLWFIVDRAKWILGGLLLPLELFPAGVRAVAEVLPFRHMIYGPARLFVHWSAEEALQLLANQALWLLIFGLAVVLIYRLGVRRVDLNGG